MTRRRTPEGGRVILGFDLTEELQRERELERARQDLSYDVTSVTTYRKGTLALHAGRIFDQTGPERLAIVTCGDWNGEVYLSNVVVIASNPRPVAVEG